MPLSCGISCSDLNLPYLTLLPDTGQQYKLCLAAHARHLTSPSCGPPSLRCLGLGGSIIVALFRFMASDPAKRSSPYSKNRSNYVLHRSTDQHKSIYFISCCNELFMAYCMVLLFPLRMNRVTYLYCRIFGFQRTQKGENKNPSYIRSL